MNDWTQPICRTCFQALCLGRGESPHREPTRVVGSYDDCLICGARTAIYVRIDPKLTEGLEFAKKGEES
jgi:hypothetical protein